MSRHERGKRKEFVLLAASAGRNMRQLCRQFRISSRTGYAWLKRYCEKGEGGLEGESRRPRHSPGKTGVEMEEKVVQMRNETGWGGRKIAQVLRRAGLEDVPHPNTITDILRRNGKISAQEQKKHRGWQRFERDTPNALWQMDFKGHFAILQGRCHPLTVLDDHSRFCLGLQACQDETGETTRACLTGIFRQYGLPVAILCDNGGPWGSGYPLELTFLSVWLIRQGIQILHGYPAHPQTQGKDERFHRTLNTEVIQSSHFASLADCQRSFDTFRERYNQVRPHEALHLDTPIQHYYPSPIPFREALPPVEYDSDQIVRKVQYGGVMYFHNHEFRVGKALRGLPVRLVPSDQDGGLDVYFCAVKVRHFSLP